MAKAPLLERLIYMLYFKHQSNSVKTGTTHMVGVRHCISLCRIRALGYWHMNKVTARERGEGFYNASAAEVTVCVHSYPQQLNTFSVREKLWLVSFHLLKCKSMKGGN